MAAKSIIRNREDSAGRSFGLGALPTDGAVEKMCKCPFPNVPVIEYVTWTIPLPLSDDQITSTFGNEIDVLQSPKQVAGVAAVDSSFVQNGTLQTTMFVVGLGIHAFGEPMSFSQIGNTVASAGVATAPLVSPDVFTADDTINGALSGVIGVTAAMDPAQLEWGFADWNAIWHMANAYQVRWTFQQRHLLINELMADVCYFGSFADGQGMGTSDATIQQFVAQTNNRYAGLGASSRFLPISHRRVGSVNAAGTGGGGTTGITGPTGATGTNVGLFHPTRDFDLAPMTWGGIKNGGTNHGGLPFRKFNKPVVLDQGIPIGINLVAQDDYHQKQMQRYMSISEGAGTNSVANVEVDPFINGYSVGTGNAGLELTLNTGGNQYVNTSVQTNRSLLKGGVMKISIQVKGFEIYGQWKKYFCDSNNAKAISPYVDVPSQTGNVSGLAGIPTNG